MTWDGILIGLCAFLIIGVFHPIVIKTEYYFSKRAYPAFLLAGILFLAASVFLDNRIVSAVLGVTGFSCLWSIKELFEQEQRVEKGWFPRNPAKQWMKRRR